MLDAYSGSLNLALLLSALSLALLFPSQFFLCRKVKSLFLRLLPVMLFACLSSVVLLFASCCDSSAATSPAVASAGRGNAVKHNRMIRRKLIICFDIVFMRYSFLFYSFIVEWGKRQKERARRCGPL